MIRQIIFTIGLLGMFVAAMPLPAQAATAPPYSPFGSVNCGTDGGQGSTVCAEKDKTQNPLTGCASDGSDTGCGTGLLDKITNIVAYIAGGVAVIMIVVGAIRYITSGSDVSVGSRIDDDVVNAKRTIVNSLIGLAIIVLAKTIINYVIKNVH